MTTQMKHIELGRDIAVVVPHGRMAEARKILSELDEFGSTKLYIRTFQDAGYEIRDERDGINRDEV